MNTYVLCRYSTHTSTPAHLPVPLSGLPVLCFIGFAQSVPETSAELRVQQFLWRGSSGGCSGGIWFSWVAIGKLQENHRKTTGKPEENGGFMGFYGIYPLAI